MVTISIGFTGTKKVISLEQREKLTALLSKLATNIKEVHHGDCVGADKQFHDICESLKLNIIIHPPINNKYRAFCKGTILKEKEYLERNKDIVDSSDLLIAIPVTGEEVLRSGTWSTVRYARRKNKRIIIIRPNGAAT